MASVSIQDLIDRKKNQLALQLLSGNSGLAKKVYHPNVTIFNPHEEFWNDADKGTVLIVGREELSDFAAGAAVAENVIFNKIKQLEVPCVFFSEVNFLPRNLIQFSETYGIPFFASKFDPYLLRSRILGFLREKIKGVATIQGVFVSVFGVGIIIKGESGLGKSECALELVVRGHRIIADDLIEIQKKKGRLIIGRSPEISRNLLYIKGIGIINIKDLYGECAVLPQSGVDMIVEFMEWKKDINVMGHEIVYNNIMDINIPLTIIPVRPNQMTTILEVVAKKYLFEKGASAPKNIQRQDR